MYGRTTTTIQSPSGPPVDLNTAGKPDWRELGPLFGLILIAVIPTAAGGAMVVSNWPGEALSGWQALWLALGATLAFVGGSFVWTLRTTVLSGVKGYYRRVNEWHDAVLDKYIEGDGMMTAQQVSEWRYNGADMRMVGAAFFWLLVTQPRSLSIEFLTRGPLMLNIGHRSVKMMDMSQDDASDFLNLLAASGLIAGRGPRKAGSIVLQDTPAQAKRLAAEAARNPALVTMPEVEQ